MGSHSRFERGLMVLDTAWAVEASVWAISGAVWAVAASAWTVTASMWAVADAVRSFIASMHAV